MIGAAFLGGLFPPAMTLEHMNAINTTNLKIVETTRLLKVTVYVALLMFMHETIKGHDDSANNILQTLGLMLFGFAGVNAAQYGLKRFSNTEMVAAKASGAPAQVVQTTGTVVAQNPGGPVDAAPVAVTASPALPVAPIVASRAGTHGIGSALSPGANQPSERDWTTSARRAAVSEPDLYRDDERGD